MPLTLPKFSGGIRGKDSVTLGFKCSKAIENDPNRVEVAFYQSGFCKKLISIVLDRYLS